MNNMSWAQAETTDAIPLAGADVWQARSSTLLSVVSSLENLAALESGWRALEASNGAEVCVFQSYDWVMAWCDTYCQQDPVAEPHVLAGYDKGELVFILPLMKSRQCGLTVLNWLTDPFGQYGDMLCKRGQSSKVWLAESIRFLQRLNDIDLMRLRHVRKDSLIENCSTMLQSARLVEGAPFLDLTQFTSEADYDARYTPVQRKRRKKIRKALEALGPVEFEKLPNGSRSDYAMQEAIQEKNLWLADRGRMNRILKCPRHTQFLRTLSRRSNSTFQAAVTEMKAGSEAVSWEIGFRHGNTHFAYITAHRNALTDLSPGRLHMDYSQRAALADGLERFDLMVPNDQHKESWSSGAEEVNDYFLPFSAKGWIAGHGYLKTLRPLVRHAYYKLQPLLPAIIRKFSVLRGKPKASTSA